MACGPPQQAHVPMAMSIFERSLISFRCFSCSSVEIEPSTSATSSSPSWLSLLAITNERISVAPNRSTIWSSQLRIMSWSPAQPVKPYTPILGDDFVTDTPPYELLHVEHVPVGEHRPVYACVQVLYRAVSALADAALHPPLKRHQYLVLRYPELHQVLHDELVHDRRSAHGRVCVLRVYRAQLLEERR